MGYGVLQPWHVIVILVIVLVIFGPGKLPMLGKAVGDTVRDFKKAVTDDAPKATVVEGEPVASMRVCPTCQKPVSQSDRFCGGCGARQDVTTAA
jgi:sec-independent protein translocase protein TatA